MNSNLKTLLLLTMFFVTNYSFCQTLDSSDIEKINNHTAKKIVTGSRISTNYAPNVKNIYAVAFEDNSFQLYDRDKDTLSKAVFKHLRTGVQDWVGLSNGKWLFYSVEWNGTSRFRTSIDSSKFDSINVFRFDHFIGYKNEKFILFHFEYNTNNLKGFSEIGSSPVDFLQYYNSGLFIRFNTKNSKTQGKIGYVDFKTGKMKSSFLVDSILNFPDPFVQYSLVQLENNILVYSYLKDQIIEESFNSYYMVPMYEYPIIIKDKYIGLGDYDKWKKIKTRKVKTVKFESFGDLILCRLVKNNGKVQNINLWTKKKITEKEHLRLTAPK